MLGQGVNADADELGATCAADEPAPSTSILGALVDFLLLAALDEPKESGKMFCCSYSVEMVSTTVPLPLILTCFTVVFTVVLQFCSVLQFEVEPGEISMCCCTVAHWRTTWSIVSDTAFEGPASTGGLRAACGNTSTGLLLTTRVSGR